MYNSLFFLVLALCCICTARVCLASSAAFSNIYATENYSGVVKIDKKASFAVRYEALDSNTLIKSVRNNFKYQAIVVILTDAFFNDNNIGMSTKTNSLKDKFLRITGMPLQYVMIEDRNHVSCLSCSLAFRHLGVFFVENFNKIIDSRYFPDRLTGINLIYFDNLDKMARRHLNEIINRESLSMKTITQDFDFSAKMRPVELALEASIQSGGRTIQVFSMLPLSTTSHDSSASANEPITIVHPTSTAEIEEQSASESEHGEESYHEPENNENTANVPQNVENTENVTEHDDSTENVTQLDDSTENITQHDENTENVPQQDETTVSASQNDESAENDTQIVENTENVTTNLATEDENLAILQSQEQLANEDEGEGEYKEYENNEDDDGEYEEDENTDIIPSDTSAVNDEEIGTSVSQEIDEGAASETEQGKDSDHELENDEGNTVNVPTTTSQHASESEGEDEDGDNGDEEGDNEDEGDNEEIDTSASQENQEGAASDSEHELENDESNTVNVPTTNSQHASESEGDNEDDNGDGEGDNEEIDTSANQENQEGAASENEHELENDEGNTVNVPTTTSQHASEDEDDGESSHSSDA